MNIWTLIHQFEHGEMHVRHFSTEERCLEGLRSCMIDFIELAPESEKDVEFLETIRKASHAELRKLHATWYEYTGEGEEFSIHCEKLDGE